MTDQRFSQEQQRPNGGKEKSHGRMLLTPPVKKQRMSRKKVEH